MLALSKERAEKDLSFLSVSTIQKAWRKCRYDPEYKMCEKVLINNMLALGVKEEDLF